MVLARIRAAPATLRLLASDGIVPMEPILELASVVHPPIVVLASVVHPSVSEDGKVALVGGDGRGSFGGGLAGEGERDERRERTFSDEGFMLAALLPGADGDGGIFGGVPCLFPDPDCGKMSDVGRGGRGGFGVGDLLSERSPAFALSGDALGDKVLDGERAVMSSAFRASSPSDSVPCLGGTGNRIIGLSDGVGLGLSPAGVANLVCIGVTGATAIGPDMTRSFSFASSFLWW